MTGRRGSPRSPRLDPRPSALSLHPKPTSPPRRPIARLSPPPAVTRSLLSIFEGGLRHAEEDRPRRDLDRAVDAAPSLRPRVVQAPARAGMTAMPTSWLDPEFFARLGSIVVIDLLL